MESDSLHRRVIEWLASRDTGMSSETMAFCACGIKRHPVNIHHPYDFGDFGRCFRLVARIPEIRDHFPEIAKLSPQWAAVIERWDELVRLRLDGRRWPKDIYSQPPTEDTHDPDA